jgi:fructokinase
MSRYDFRIGIDLGGTKIEATALDRNGDEALRRRVATPKGYDATLNAIADLVSEMEEVMGGHGSVGIGIPGVISAATGLVKNANSIALNGNRFDVDLGLKLGRDIRVENDANCFALSEASDGAGSGFGSVFGVIVGTGCGSGIVVDGRVLKGRNRIAGEWGHTPLPWPQPSEYPGTSCWCGQRNCLETWIAGPSLACDAYGPGATDASSLPAEAAAGDANAIAALARHADRMARGLAVIVNVLDPDAIVLGGGLSNMDHLYLELPKLLKKYAFSDVIDTPILRNKHGDSSGVRGAAWLWPAPT